MGWTEMDKPANVMDWVRKLCTWEDAQSGRKLKCLDAAMVDFTQIYTAIENEDSFGVKTVSACVFSIQFTNTTEDGHTYSRMGYKAVDEEAGPLNSNCPERILKLLSPTDNKHAKDWRERCWEKVVLRKSVPKIAEGDFIKLEKPIQFSNGKEYDTFRVYKFGRAMRFTAVSPETGYPLSPVIMKNWRSRPFEKMDKDNLPWNAARGMTP